ncbi:iron permease FTR1 family protein [Bordetella holmesii ATCC 51541]|nr:iron permease FTR1 family protein [Bordetella holmesii ATCC 51541]
MEQVAFIVWRESVEALLVVGILYSWLRATPEGRRGMPYLWGGVAAGLGLALLLALVLLGVSEWLTDSGQEWFQAGMSLVACVLVVQMVIWMKRHGRTLKRELEGGARQSVANDNWWGLLILVMIAVAREGSETVVFLYGTVSAAQDGAARSCWPWPEWVAFLSRC